MHMLRRSFLVGVSALALAAGAQAREFRGGIPWTSGKAQPPNDFDAARRFLTDQERTFLTAAVDRLIPADDTPSASELGVVDYIDFQLAGAYGRGDIYYLQPPFQTGLATQGYQAEAPALLYRQAIADIEAFLEPDLLFAQIKQGFAALAESGPDYEGYRFPVALPAMHAEGAGMVLAPGLLPGIPAYTIKVNSKFPGHPPAIKGAVLLFSLEDGQLLAVLDSSSLTALLISSSVWLPRPMALRIAR